MNYTTYMPVTGTIINSISGSGCCSQIISLRTENGIINFDVTAETLIIDNRELRPGMRVTAYYDSSLPVPMIFPPRYFAQLIAVPGRNEQIALDFFNRDLVAADRSLQLNIAGNTIIETVNGQRFTCDLADRMLLVFYSITTRSIPPQTTPRRIVVLC